jgi:vacuolar-type H+-ATPase subunit D/Vma8
MGTPLEVITNPPDPRHRQLVTAKELLNSLEVKRGELTEERWEIVQQICRVREMMEQCEAGEMGEFHLWSLTFAALADHI